MKNLTTLLTIFTHTAELLLKVFRQIFYIGYNLYKKYIEYIYENSYVARNSHESQLKI